MIFFVFIYKKQKRRIQATCQMHHRVGEVREQVIVCLKSQQGRSKTKCLAGSTFMTFYKIKVFYLFLIGKLKANIKRKIENQFFKSVKKNVYHDFDGYAFLKFTDLNF